MTVVIYDCGVRGHRNPCADCISEPVRNFFDTLDSPRPTTAPGPGYRGTPDVPHPLAETPLWRRLLWPLDLLRARWGAWRCASGHHAFRRLPFIEHGGSCRRCGLLSTEDHNPAIRGLKRAIGEVLAATANDLDPPGPGDDVHY